MSYASILAAQRQNDMNISLIGWFHLGSPIVSNKRWPCHKVFCILPIPKSFDTEVVMNSWWLKMLTISIWSWNVLFWEDEDKGGEDAEEDANVLARSLFRLRAAPACNKGYLSHPPPTSQCDPMQDVNAWWGKTQDAMQRRTICRNCCFSQPTFFAVAFMATNNHNHRRHLNPDWHGSLMRRSGHKETQFAEENGTTLE